MFDCFGYYLQLGFISVTVIGFTSLLISPAIYSISDSWREGWRPYKFRSPVFKIIKKILTVIALWLTVMFLMLLSLFYVSLFFAYHAYISSLFPCPT